MHAVFLDNDTTAILASQREMENGTSGVLASLSVCCGQIDDCDRRLVLWRRGYSITVVVDHVGTSEICVQD